MSWTGGWLITLALGANGCGSGAAPAGQTVTTGQSPSGAAHLIRSDALSRVAHSGLRRLEFHPATVPGLAFRERITTDGQGNFAIEPVEALGSSVLDWASFELLQRSSEGFIFRYRDFAVRDERLFERNYTWTDLKQPLTVAGRRCERFRVERRVGVRATYELSIDASTGLMLACDEFDDAGRLAASMVYEEVDLDPALEALAWHRPVNQEQALDRRQSLADQVEAPTLQPKLLPTGYALREAATVVDGQSRRWLKLAYLDGVEPLFFFQALGPRTDEDRPAGVTLSEPTRPEPQPSRMVVFQIGTAMVIQGTVSGFDLIAIGKVPQAEMLDLIESALP